LDLLSLLLEITLTSLLCFYLWSLAMAWSSCSDADISTVTWHWLDWSNCPTSDAL